MRLLDKLIWRTRRVAKDDEGSLPLAMLVIMVGIGLSATLAPVAINQLQNTTYSSSRDRELAAAEAGMEVIVGKLRSAVDSTTGKGDTSQLPCTTDSTSNVTTPISGAVDSGTEQYIVTVDYYVLDPVKNPSAIPMYCVPGQGTYDTTSQLVTPHFAKLVSTGCDNQSGSLCNLDRSNSTSKRPGGSIGRSITSVYALTVDNSNISGGTIRIYPTTPDSSQFCLDAGTGPWTANVSTVSLQVCSSSYPPAAQQTFAYTNDLTLQLTASVGTVSGGVTYKNGLCIDIASTTTSSGVSSPASGSSLVLKQCGNTGSPIWSQQWAFDGFAAFHAPTSKSASNGTLSSYCMAVTVTGGSQNNVAVGTHSAGAVTLKTCDGTFPTPTNTWISSPAVGAGAASGQSSQQFVNFGQFGECIHDPRADPTPTFLIAGSCLQNPLQSAIGANQQLTFGSLGILFGNVSTATQDVGQLYFNYSGTLYCIYSPLVAATDTVVADHRVSITPCYNRGTDLNGRSIGVAGLRWTRSNATTNASTGTPFSTKYRFIDNIGLCMGLSELYLPNDRYSNAYDPWKKIVTASCDNSTFQQWQANNNIQISAYQNTREN